jgi:hypothetical protein
VLFTFQKPKGRDRIESAVGFAALSRFVIADLTEPKSLPTELQQIVTDLSFIAGGADHQRNGTRICHV